MNRQEKSKEHDMLIVKIVQGTITVLLAGIVVMLLCVFFLPQCMGYQPYRIETDAMAPKYPVGSVVYVKPVLIEQLKVGDVVAYKPSLEEKREVSQPLTKIDTQTGVLMTKGDTNQEDGILYTSVVGKATKFSIPFLGEIVTQYQNGYGKAITIACIVFLLVLSFIIDFLCRRK